MVRKCHRPFQPSYLGLCYTAENASCEGQGSHSIVMSAIRNFLYRFPRFNADSRVDFISGETIHLGNCSEISESGLRCCFPVSVLPGSQGLITLYRNDKSFSAHASILEVEGDEATAVFDFQSAQEQASVREFIKALTSF